jgi:hypothetical protein
MLLRSRWINTTPIYLVSLSKGDLVKCLYGFQYNSTNKHYKFVWEQIRVSVWASLWALWNVGNDYIFKKVEKIFYAGPLATHWIRMWSFLQPIERREALVIRCNRLELIAWDLYNQSSWRFYPRLTCWCRVITCWYMFQPCVIYDIIFCKT